MKVLTERLFELEKQNRDLREELEMISIIFESQEGMLITDSNSIILRANQAYVELSGFSLEEIVGMQPSVFHTGLYEESFYQNIRDTLKAEGFWQGNIKDRRKDGLIYVQRLNISVIKSPEGSVNYYVASFTDNTTENELSDKIHQLAYYDSLTNLPNRRLFLNRLERALELSERNEMCGALFFIDLDNFKILNDTLGHDTGDLLLTQVASRLSNCLRKSDTVARLGGDEFVVILEEVSSDLKETASQAREVGEKIIMALNQNYQLKEHSHQSTPSIGVALFNANNKSLDELLKQADIAMYVSKAAGGNSLHFFDPEMQAAIIADTELKTDLTEAVDKQQFKLYFQLLVNHKNQMIGAEALLRWQHPELGLVAPNDFIPMAEKSGLILPIGLWVLETGCAQLKQWRENPHTRHLQLSINISAHQFYQDCFVQQVYTLLKKYNIQAKCLKLELTESLLLDKIDKTIVKMQELKEMGVSFSMDDFGMGYSSLAYLTKLPFDQLKIDQSFVHNIDIKPADTVVVKTIIGMADNLGIDVIAEGVETEAQRTFLIQQGCLVMQGFLFGKPMSIEQFEQSLLNNSNLERG